MLFLKSAFVARCLDLLDLLVNCCISVNTVSQAQKSQVELPVQLNTITERFLQSKLGEFENACMKRLIQQPIYRQIEYNCSACDQVSPQDASCQKLLTSKRRFFQSAATYAPILPHADP